MDQPGDITQALGDVAADVPGATDRLLDLVAQRLRDQAGARLASLPPWRTLEPTDLVGELYLRVFGHETVPTWENSGAFFGHVARSMRDIVVERARAATTQKRGGDHQRVPLDDDAVALEEAERFLEVNEALSEFERLHERASRVVYLRYFCGLTEGTAAEVLNISRETASRDFALAKGWLRKRLGR